MSNEYNFTKQELAAPISELGLSTRATNALAGAGIETLDDLLHVLTTRKLQDFRNIGKTSLEEIHIKIAEMQTSKYRDFKTAETAINNHKAEIKSKIEQYNKLIQELTTEQEFYDKQMDTLRQNYAKQNKLSQAK